LKGSGTNIYGVSSFDTRQIDVNGIKGFIYFSGNKGVSFDVTFTGIVPTIT
jgi:hypothetical protein